VRWLLRALALIALIYLVAFADVVITSRIDQRRPVDAIVVLGAAQYNGHPSPVLKARLDHAFDLYRAGVARTIVVTGGIGEGDHVSEAAAAEKYLETQGVPAAAVVPEAGRTTAMSMDSVAQYLRGQHERRVLLVSDPFHLARLHLEAWRVGLEGYTSPTHTSPISRNFTTELGYFIAEAAKLPVIFVRALVGPAPSERNARVEGHVLSEREPRVEA
jgi:uncharacterized SAM-binding protein YcdF (DUF218 family)